VVLRSLTAPLCVATATIRELGVERVSIAMRSEWWTAVESRVECMISSPQGAVTFSAEVMRELASSDTVVISAPTFLELRDRRRHVRRSFDAALFWARVERGREMGDPRQGLAVDLSVGGIGFRSVVRPPEDGLLAVSFELDGAEVTTIVRPVRVQPLSFPAQGLRYLTSGEIVAVSDQDRAAIESCVGQPRRSEQIATSRAPQL